jgi:serine/threonine protein kinase
VKRTRSTEELRIQLHDGNLLGEGAYGVVYQVFFQGKKCAAKRYPEIKSGQHRTTEIEAYKKVTCPYIPKLLGLRYGEDTYDHIMITEFVKGKTLASINSITAEQMTLLIHDVTLALKELHCNDLAHCDLNPHNIMLEQDRAVLIDLGRCKNKEDYDIISWISVCRGELENLARLLTNKLTNDATSDTEYSTVRRALMPIIYGVYEEEITREEVLFHYNGFLTAWKGGDVTTSKSTMFMLNKFVN